MAEETTSNENANQAAAPGAEDQATPKPAAKKPPKAEAGAEGDAPPKAKKEKAPALEDKPFADYVQHDFLPALKEGLAKQGVADVDLTFAKQKIAISGLTDSPECWQVIGRWNSGWKQPRQFNLYFLKDDIQGPKGFSYSESGGKTSTLESFLIDERKVNLGLLVFGVLQRLNAQKWLVRN